MMHVLRAFLGLAILVGLSRAQVPRRFGVQGRLEDSAGQPQTGATSLTLRLFDQASGGSPLHQETATVDLDAAGRFRTALGDLSPLDPAELDTSLWLEVEPSSGPLGPRLPLLPAPTSLASVHAEGLLGRVHPVPHDGDDASSGARLLAEAAALPTSQSRVLLLSPGTYDLGATTLELVTGTSLVGAGPRSTVLTSTAAIGLEVWGDTRLVSLALDLERFVDLRASGIEIRDVLIKTRQSSSLNRFGGLLPGDRLRVTDSEVRSAELAAFLSGSMDVEGPVDWRFRDVRMVVESGSTSSPCVSVGLSSSTTGLVLDRVHCEVRGTGGTKFGVIGGQPTLLRSRILLPNPGDPPLPLTGAPAFVFGSQLTGDVAGASWCGSGNYDADFAPVPDVACP